jgi:hypothetical protein
MKIIGIIGKKGSGKTTFANYLQAEFEKAPKELALRFSFGKPLKQMIEQAEICSHKELYEEKTAFSRLMMQKIGTEIIRRIDPDYFCKQMWNGLHTAFSHEPTSIIIIDDVRFKNEAQLIRSLGGILIKIEREIQKQEDNHTSEIEQDTIRYHLLYQNNVSLENLQKQAQYFCSWSSEENANCMPTRKEHFRKENTKSWRSFVPRSRYSL